MSLFETAFAYVLRAFRTEDLPLSSDEPRAAMPAAIAADESGRNQSSVALLMHPTLAGTVVLDGGEDEFSDLLSGIGAVATPPAEVSDLERKDREIAELQRNLEMLRPIGDELARIEQLRLAERASFETQLSELRGELETQRRAGPSSPSAPGATQASGPERRDVSRLLEALDTTLLEARSSSTIGGSKAEDSQRKEQSRLARAREQLVCARKRLAEQKQKTAQRRAEGQELRHKLRSLEREHRALITERKLLHAPVRELVRRAERRTKPLLRLVELLGLEIH